MPQWINGPVAPGPQPTVVLVPKGTAWAAYPARTLHLGMDKIGDASAETPVRVAVHNGTNWGEIVTETVKASAGVVDVVLPVGTVKLSLQADTEGVAYAIEVW